jgi:hypothetical protein
VSPGEAALLNARQHRNAFRGAGVLGCTLATRSADSLDGSFWPTFELWLTGVLSPEAQKRIADAQATIDPSRYTIKVMLARDIEESVKTFPDLQKLVKVHFLEQPMAAPIDVINPVSKRKISQAAARFSHLAHIDYGSEDNGAAQSPA